MDVVRGHQVLGAMREQGHEEVLHATDQETGLQAIVAVHSTALGPALGGTRFYPYPDESSALADVLRLAKGMSLKSAAAGLWLGGGKAVILGDPAVDKTDELLEAYGRVVDSLGGRYITAEDMGTDVDDMLSVSKVTRWVSGLPLAAGGSGDPSLMTARGVVAAMRAVAAHLRDTTSLTGLRVAVQGVGKVGTCLVRLLTKEGCEVTIADISYDRVEELGLETGARAARVEDILTTDCDIVAPCALGSVLDPTTIGALRCRAVIGSANNQLAEGFDASLLAAAGILYAPDFVVNAGGIINISLEFDPEGYSPTRAEQAVDGIFDTMAGILLEADRKETTPLEAAMRLALERIRAASIGADSSRV